MSQLQKEAAGPLPGERSFLTLLHSTFCSSCEHFGLWGCSIVHFCCIPSCPSPGQQPCPDRTHNLTVAPVVSRDMTIPGIDFAYMALAIDSLTVQGRLSAAPPAELPLWHCLSRSCQAYCRSACARTAMSDKLSAPGNARRAWRTWTASLHFKRSDAGWPTLHIESAFTYPVNTGHGSKLAGKPGDMRTFLEGSKCSLDTIAYRHAMLCSTSQSSAI